MALSAHLTAVQSGMALMLAGLAWPQLASAANSLRIARATLIGGMYGLWLGLTLAAATGASASLPIAGTGFAAGQAAETAVTWIVIGSSLLMTIGWAIFTVLLLQRGPVE